MPEMTFERLMREYDTVSALATQLYDDLDLAREALRRAEHERDQLAADCDRIEDANIKHIKLAEQLATTRQHADRLEAELDAVRTARDNLDRELAEARREIGDLADTIGALLDDDLALAREALRRAEQERDEWSDIAYEMWAMLCNSTNDGHSTSDEWYAARDRLRDRFHAALPPLGGPPDEVVPE